jgi:hypothetical protein
MNKIKVLYDVFKTMKEKEVFKGNIKLEATKGEVKVLSFSNQFETNTQSGETKAKINVDLDAEGKKVKHESSSEFNIKDCPHHKFHRGMGMHMNNHGMHGHGGIKAGLSKVTFVLNLLNNMQVEEKEGKSVISLELKEVLKEIKDMHKDFHKDINDEKISEYHKQMHKGINIDNNEFHKHHVFIKELLCSEQSNAVLKIYANKNNEIEKAEISAKGENTIDGSLDLVW